MLFAKSPNLRSRTVCPRSVASAQRDEPDTVSCFARLKGHVAREMRMSAFFTPGSSNIATTTLSTVSNWMSVQMV